MGKLTIPIAILMVYVAILVVGVVAVVLLVQRGDPDYADLIPAPDAIKWRVGDEIPLWLSTNRHAVDVRLSSIGLGIGEIDIRDPSGRALPLGKGLGCLDAIVSELDASDITNYGATLTLRLDRAVEGAVPVHWRRYREDEAPPEKHHTAQVWLPVHAVVLSGLSKGDTLRFDASTDEHFPVAITRTVTFTFGDDDSGTSDHREEEVHLIEGTGVTLVACAATEDIVVSLHGDDGQELNRYRVDILPAGPSVPDPETPARHVTRRVCADALDSRADYLDGGEKVGAAFSPADFGLTGTTTYALSTVPEASEDIYFFEITGSGQLTVGAAGAADYQGIDSDRLYTVRVTATDSDGTATYLNVGVWLDASATSTNRDGLCPPSR